MQPSKLWASTFHRWLAISCLVLQWSIGSIYSSFVEWIACRASISDYFQCMHMWCGLDFFFGKSAKKRHGKAVKHKNCVGMAWCPTVIIRSVMTSLFDIKMRHVAASVITDKHSYTHTHTHWMNTIPLAHALRVNHVTIHACKVIVIIQWSCSNPAYWNADTPPNATADTRHVDTSLIHVVDAWLGPKSITAHTPYSVHFGNKIYYIVC